jgi:hypothetical protein
MQVLAVGFVSNVKIKGKTNNLFKKKVKQTRKETKFLAILSMIHTHINMLSPTTFGQHELPGRNVLSPEHKKQNSVRTE